MTMVPAQISLSKHQQYLQQQQQQQQFASYSGYGGCVGGYSESFGGLMSRLEGTYDYSASEATCLGSDNYLINNPNMAEDESRTNSDLNEAAASSSKDVLQEDHHHHEREGDHEGWLQLSIGGNSNNTASSRHDDTKDENHHHNEIDPTARREGLIELDLLPGSSSRSLHQQIQARSLSAPIFHAPAEYRAAHPTREQPVININSTAATNFSTSLFFQQQVQQQHHQGSSSSSTYHHHQEISWAFRPVPNNIAMASSSSSSPSSSAASLMNMGAYFSRPFQLHSGMDMAGPSSDFRVIDRPRRPHSGVWFMLQASQNQAKEPFLPQISKSYLRIKDGRMTVRLIMKYLVTKLRLDSESEIEITCRGQQLQPSLTLQHVRDNIWSPRDAVTLLPDSSTADHVMVLHYGRSA